MRRQIVQATVILMAGVLIGAILFGGNAKSVVDSTSATSSVAAAEIAAVAQPAVDTYPVVRVVDGDTLAVEMNGKSVKVRLIGLDTPETVDPRKPVQCFGKEASAKAKELLTGKSIRLEKDASQGEYDKYGRLLAYGYGHEYTYNLPYKYQKEFK